MIISDKIANLIEKAIKKAQKEKELLNFEIPKILIEHPENAEFGDFSSNIAMKITKIANKNPIETAQIIYNQLLPANNKFLEKIEIKKPGFINFFLSDKFLLNEINRIAKEKHKYGSDKTGKGKTIIIDYSSPNIAKRFGIGHLRSTIIGQAIYNIYKFLGWKCIGDNYLGDWGTQFGKLIYQIKKEKILLKDLTIEKLEKLYVEFYKQAENKPKIQESARNWFRKLEQGDEDALKIWQICKDISLKEFNKIYKLLDIKIDYTLGESFYQKKIDKVIKEVVNKKIAVRSKGALIIKYPKNKLPSLVLLKSDKAATYFTRNLAQVRYRLKKWNPDLIIYEVGTDQSLFFKQLFLVVELLGWSKKTKFLHIAHGLVRWKHGKFSTRKGDTIHLEQILEEAIIRAGKIIEQSETNRGLLKKEKQKIAEIVGIGAVKYNDLSQHYSSDIIFDWNKILNLKGNSGPYIQYTYARCQSIIRKSKSKKIKMIKSFNFNEQEKNILRTIYKFPEIIQTAADQTAICLFTFGTIMRDSRAVI